MRDVDIEFLKRPYAPPAEEAESPAYRAALGVDIPATLKLRDSIFNDLDESAFGIGWWKEPDEARRIFISDYLVGCAWSIETNLIEARLHLLEALGFAEQHARAMSDAVKVQGNIVRVQAPTPTCAADELPLDLMAMHIGGLFRAVGSALDCIGGLVVGVLALPARLYKADLGAARVALEKALKQQDDPGDLRRTLLAKMNESAASAGPPGWLEWANAYRNMLVHRGRRLNQNMLVPRHSLLRPDGSRIIRTEVVHLVMRDPERSDVETLVDGLVGTLTEPAEVTLRELLKSTVWFTEEMARALLAAWEARRANPSRLRQPRQQWPDVPRPSGVFKGYEPGRVEVDPSAAMMGTSWVKRLKAASMDGDAKRNWKSFLEAAQVETTEGN
jgi:hypothetical protein